MKFPNALPFVTLALVPLASASIQDGARRVEVERVVKKDLVRRAKVIGGLHPYQKTMLQPRVEGYLETLGVEPGDRLGRGDEIGRIAVPDLEAKREALVAAVEEARAGILDAEAGAVEARAAIDVAEANVALRAAEARVSEADLDLAQVQADRVRRLVEENAASPEELDLANGELQRAKARGEVAISARDAAVAMVSAATARAAAADARIESAKAMLAAAEGEVKPYDVMIGFATLVNPYEVGLVSARHVDPGTLMRPGESTIVTLMDVSRIRVFLDVAERDTPHVKRGTDVEIRLDAYPNDPVRATVTRVSGALDPDARTMHAEVELENDGRLMPGMFCHAFLVTQRSENALTVPASAIYADGKSTWVLVADGATARRRDLVLGMDDGMVAEVREGLTGTERVIVGRPIGLGDGDSIRYGEE